MKLTDKLSAINEVLDNNPAIMFFIDTHFNILWSNQAYKKILGLPEESLWVQRCYSNKRNSRPCHDCPVRKTLETGESCFAMVQFDAKESHRDEDSFWIMEASPVKDSSGENCGVFVVAHDSSECEWVKRQLERKDLHVAELIETIEDIVWTCDLHGKATYVNRAVEKVLGYSRNEYLTTPYSELIHPDDIGQIENEIPRYIREKKAWRNVVARWKHKEGRWLELESSAIPMFDSGGEVIGFRGIDRDISERKILMEQLAQSQKMEAMGRFAGGIAHDSNNLLGVILGYSEVILSGMKPSDEIRRALEQIRNAAMRSADLTKQLLTYARKQVTKPEVVDLNERVSKILGLLRRLIGEDIKLTWLPREELWWVRIDPNQVDQVLTNLCVNSRDAIEGVGEIAISTSNIKVTKAMCRIRRGMIPGNFVLMKVTDTGKGIGAEIIDRIFDPFFTTKPIGKGTGLGLSTVFGIIKQNDGFIYAFSEPAKNTKFEIYLPKYTGEINLDTKGPGKDTIKTGTESVLLVEDEEAKLEIVEIFLKKLGYDVTAENSSVKALRIFKRNPNRFDLVITDMVMPELRGRQLRDAIRAINPGVKYIFMSGYGLDSESPISIDENEPFLQKPFSQKDLALKVREVLDSPAPAGRPDQSPEK